MKRLSYLIGSILGVLTISLATIISPKTLAGNSSPTNNAGSSNNCVMNSVRPSPYTGGAGVAKVFYPSDGSTVTITTTGAVIKQSPCGTPYREGWVNPSRICDVNSAASLSGNIAAGSSNPYAVTSGRNRTFDYSCNANTSTDSDDSTSSGSGAAASASATSNAAAAAVTHPVIASAATQTPATSVSASGKAVLPNTGPGDVLAVGGISTFLGTIGHFFVARYRRA